jgi:hypothetical protein
MASWTEEKIVIDEGCDEYTYNNFKYTQTGSYYQIKEGTPTDTLVILNLIIYKTEDLDLSISQTDNVLTANTVGATYQWVDCDNGNAVINGETNQSFTATISGNYAVIITQNDCTGMSDCVNMIVSGIEGSSVMLNTVSIYPNPNNGSFTVVFGRELSNAKISVRDMLGRLVYTTTVNGDKQQIELNEARGTYFVHIETELGEFAIFRLVVQ